jgi:hypothetical protein
MQQSEAAPQPFALHEDGTVSIGGSATEEMDIAAEQLARGMMSE